MSQHLQRAELLLKQNRYAEAEAEVQQVLLEDPDAPRAHLLLGRAKLGQEHYKEALEATERAIGLDPEDPNGYLLKGVIHFNQEQLQSAERDIRRALELVPENPEAYGLLAWIHCQRSQWQKALEAAESGLAIDAENVSCVNARAHALVKTGRRSDAHNIMEAALAREPENSWTHTQAGWAKLESGDREGALHHFGEALRIDATNESAREGIIATLKAKHLIYGLLLKYFFFMSRLSGQGKIAVIIGGFLAFRFTRAGLQAAGHEQWAVVVGLVWMLLVFLTWGGSFLFDFALMFNRYGRMALTDRRKCFAWLSVGAVALASFAFCLNLALQDEVFYLVGIASMLLVIPLASAFHLRKDRRKVPILLGLGAAGAIIAGIVCFFLGMPDLTSSLSSLTLLSLAVYSWVGGALHLKDR